MIASPGPVRRYVPARALPAYAYLPNRTVRPSMTTPSCDPLDLTEHNWHVHEDYLWGVDLYNTGFIWEAHEAWESVWRRALRDSSVHTFLQALIQCAAASVKLAVAEHAAAQRIATRGLGRLSRVQRERGRQYMGVDLPVFQDAFEHFMSAQPVILEARPYLWLAMPGSGRPLESDE